MEVVLTLNVTEDVGSDEREQEHRNGQGAVRQHLSHFGVQERATRRRRRTHREGDNC